MADSTGKTWRQRITGGVSALSGIFSRASLENPSTSLSDWDDGGSYHSTSGVVVSLDKALRHPPFWRAVNMLSADFAKLPADVFKRVKGGKERDIQHPAHRLLTIAPNKLQTVYDFKRQLQANAATTGNGYAYIVRDGAARPTELLPLDPSRVTPVRKDGEAWYLYRWDDGAYSRYHWTDVIHLMGLSLDGMCGLDFISYCRDALGHGIAAQSYGSRFFANSARPGVILEHPKSLSPTAAANIIKSWNDMYQGADNVHKTAVLYEGMTAKPFTISAKDAMLIETIKLSIVDVSNFFGIPPHKLGDTSANAYNSRTEENQAYLDQALNPILVQFEAQCKAKLLTEDERNGDTHTVDVNRNALEQADIASRTEYYRTGLAGAAWLSIDEVRAAEGMNEVGGDASEIQQPTNNFADQGPADTTEGDDVTTPARSSLPATLTVVSALATADATARIAKRLAVHASKCRTPAEIRAMIENIEADHGGTCRNIAVTADALHAVATGNAPNLVPSMFATFRQAVEPAKTATEIQTAVEAWQKAHQ